MSVTAFAPASIGNMSVGFDILGLAIQPVDGTPLGDTVTITASIDAENQLRTEGRFVSKLPDNKDNIVWVCLHDFNQRLQEKGINPAPVYMTLNKHMPIGSGLGSSACSVVATLVALNAFYQHPFTDAELLYLMGSAEAHISGSLHYDNVAPCFLGGLQLMLDQSTRNEHSTVTQSLPVMDDWTFVIAYSGINVSTKKAREILPDTYPRATVIQQAQKLAAFMSGLYTHNNVLALNSIEDHIAEPYRTSLLPGFTTAKRHLLNNSAKAVGISGSGPTLFAIFTDAIIAKQAVSWLKENYLQTSEGFVHECHCDHKGAWVTQKDNG